MIEAYAIPARKRVKIGRWLLAAAVLLNCLTFSPDDPYVPPPGILGALLTSAVIAQLLLYPACAIFLGWGCYLSALAKGHSPWLGVLGILPVLGWIVVWTLPDNPKEIHMRGFPVIERR